MWIMTEDGFFSIVMGDRPGRYVVRARDRADLDRLRKTLRLEGLSNKVHATPKRDYEFRMHLEDRDVSRYLSMKAAGINYTNFKSMVEKRLGKKRSDIYHKVWEVLLQIGSFHTSNFEDLFYEPERRKLGRQRVGPVSLRSTRALRELLGGSREEAAPVRTGRGGAPSPAGVSPQLTEGPACASRRGRQPDGEARRGRRGGRQS